MRADRCGNADHNLLQRGVWCVDGRFFERLEQRLSQFGTDELLRHTRLLFVQRGATLVQAYGSRLQVNAEYAAGFGV